MNDIELWVCKHCIAGEDAEGITVPWCSLNDMACDDVLRFGDDGCKYEEDDVDREQFYIEEVYS